jgi:hypothetical protein
MDFKPATMTEALALAYIPSRMEELGHEAYSLRLRHFLLGAKKKLKVHGDGQLFLLLEPDCMISVSSDSGVFDLTQTNINELSYEHQGSIRIRNYGAVPQSVKFIQVIPKAIAHAQ